MPSQSHDLIDRRGLLQCMGWAGTGALFTLSAGVASSVGLDAAHAASPAPAKVKPFRFVQISDSHIGFKKPANPDPLGTLRETIAKIRALPIQPDFVLHTGDITHLATAQQFDTAQAALSELGLPIHFIPGEHDIVDGADPRLYLERFGASTKGEGCYSFDTKGVHFIGLVSVVHLGEHGQGALGRDQLAWLRDDVAHLSTSTPVVVFSDFPLRPLFPERGWGTVDAGPALGLLQRFGSVTVAAAAPGSQSGNGNPEHGRGFTRPVPVAIPSMRTMWGHGAGVLSGGILHLSPVLPILRP